MKVVDVDELRAKRDEKLKDKSLGKENEDRDQAKTANKDARAYEINVTVLKPGSSKSPGRQFVIILGLDDNAPYRLVASRFIGRGR